MTCDFYRILGSAFIAVIILISAQASAYPRHFTILHFNDFHAQFLPVKNENGEMGGAARLAHLISRIRKENWQKGKDTFVLFGGDAFTGSPISGEFRGRAEMDYLKAAGVDAMVIGNHEFDYGVARLEELMESSKFPILSANIYWKQDGERFVEPFAGVARYSTTLDVLGLTGKDTPESVTPGYLDELRFADPVWEAAPDVKELLQRGNVIVALTHQGVDEDVRLAKKVRGLSAVIGGHDHVSADGYCRLVNETPVCQTPNGGAYVGRIEFEIDGENAKYIGSELIPVVKREDEDPAVKKMVDDWERVISRKYDVIVGMNRNRLEAGRGNSSKLGAFVAEALAWKTGADACFVNSGGVRADLPAGNVTLRDVKTILPFENRAVLFNMKGSTLKKAIQYGVKRGGGAYPQVHNIAFDEAGGRTSNLTVGGEPVAPRKNYDICTIEYLAKGGDGYEMLEKLPAISMTDENMDDIFAEYIRRQGIINR